MSIQRPAAAPLALEDAAMHRELVQCGTQTGLVQALSALHAKGVLTGAPLSFKARKFAKSLTAAKQAHANHVTPYGRVVQQMPLATAKLPTWEYCDPMALLVYLASVSIAFFDIIADAVESAAGGVLRMILYIDEICPGNPLRHDKGRTLQAVYWCFAEWPAWLLARTGAWPVFGFLRSSVLKELRGGCGHFVSIILLTFFPEECVRRSLLSGIVLTSPDGRTLFVKAEFGGFLADRKALVEIYDFRGAMGALRNSYFCICAHTHTRRVSLHDIELRIVSTILTSCIMYIRHHSVQLLRQCPRHRE